MTKRFAGYLTLPRFATLRSGAPSNDSASAWYPVTDNKIIITQRTKCVKTEQGKFVWIQINGAGISEFYAVYLESIKVSLDPPPT